MGAAVACPTVGEALAEAIARLAAAGVPEPRADAEILLAHVLRTDRTGLVVGARRPLADPDVARLEPLLARRASREPVFHLVGEREFWSLPFVVDRRVLIPRPETEVLVETACTLAPGARRVLDVGTGSGVIAAALARELPEAAIWASDLLGDALDVARRNLARHAPRVTLVRGDLLAPFRTAAFDLVVSNPPYCTLGEMEGLEPEVRDYEPRSALVAADGGLAALLTLVATAPVVLRPDGWLMMEMGAGQRVAVDAAACADGRYARTVVRSDLAGIERVLAAQVVGRGGPWTAS
jgi:release factor glutamine methyltransferase